MHGVRRSSEISEKWPEMMSKMPYQGPDGVCPGPPHRLKQRVAGGEERPRIVLRSDLDNVQVQLKL